MKVIELSFPHTFKKEELEESVAAIGFFDGIHKGHKKVINTAIQKAKEQNRNSAVITFYPHPSVVLGRNIQHVEYITPLKEKEKLLEDMGVDILFLITFNKELSKLSPEKFIDHFIIGLNIKHLVCGFDFSYGYKGQGSIDTISTHSKGEFNYTVIEKQEEEKQKVSSSLVRSYMSEGRVDEVKKLLERPLYITGVVSDGEKRGSKIGFPTVNLKLTDEFLLPKIGVYAVTIKYKDKNLKGMANLGHKPTFNKEKTIPTIEVFIFDFNERIYGEKLTVEWQMYIRDEKKFNNIDELVNQLKEDEQQIRSFFALI